VSKPILCAECGRRFPHARSVMVHAAAAHAVYAGPEALLHPLTAAYDDGVMAVVVKPQGVCVVGDKYSLLRSDLFLPFRAGPDSDRPLTKPRPVHRLDLPTGGLLVLAKTVPAEVALRGCFEYRTCHKRYRAIVYGRVEDGRYIREGQEGPPAYCDDAATNANYSRTPDGGECLDEGGGVKDTGMIESTIGGKHAVSRYVVIRRTRSPDSHDGWISTVDLYPVTGRTHQLRRHMKLMGHPIWGDKKYRPKPFSKGHTCNNRNDMDLDEEGGADPNSMVGRDFMDKECPHTNLCLWALEIRLPHPVTGKTVTVKIDEPPYYEGLRQDQERHWIGMHDECR